jgi:DNA-directed RNA polymerase subunit RPC12/RpoP
MGEPVRYACEECDRDHVGDWGGACQNCGGRVVVKAYHKKTFCCLVCGHQQRNFVMYPCIRCGQSEMAEMPTLEETTMKETSTTEQEAGTWRDRTPLL